MTLEKIIKIKYKDGTVKDITDASDNLNVSAPAKPSQNIIYLHHILRLIIVAQ